jgi:hypothetical protein
MLELVFDNHSRRRVSRRRRADQMAVAETVLVSRGGCIASALTGQSVVEVVGAILGTIGSGAGRGLAAVATR